MLWVQGLKWDNMMKQPAQVFGISNTILQDSYVDRAQLDMELNTLLDRPKHIALKGEFKCGKSWLRQKIIPDALVIQCRLTTSVNDLYIDALSQLEIKLELSEKSQSTLSGKVTATGAIGVKILASLGFTVDMSLAKQSGKDEKSAGHDINDLRFIANILKESNRRLVIEDFHYLSSPERKSFSFDLKALWDYGLFVIVIGIWGNNNFLQFLNPDLTGRVNERPITWDKGSLRAVIDKGSLALNIEFSEEIKRRAIEECIGNVGILQTLLLSTLDNSRISPPYLKKVKIENIDYFHTACMQYAEELNSLYQQFARRVADGIRKRKDATGIYAHAMAVIMESDDSALLN